MKFIASLSALALLAVGGCKQAPEPVAAPETTNTMTATIPPGGTWADVVNQTPANGYLMGNPDAKVKLIEIASLSCPFCKQFEENGVPQLVDKYVKTGQVSFEFRPYLIHGPIDVAANLIARCNGPAGFFPMARALYKDQAVWVGKVEAAPQAKLAEIQNLPPDRAFVAMADLAGLQAFAAARGLPRAKSAQCLADQQMVAAEVQTMNDVNTEFPEFKGTPSFVINGQLLPREASNWAGLEPLLQAALR
ncbi:thioredoxin domain-containing protein [Sphingomonas rhizophila]|jgi:protein-disulfide isomerase|uniref:Thioredoxin domain-containing protein n=1 Tax=Sphingomonas rhizophila TaxID=2071607 RepID=A0A7G9S8T7_9SPHN|nr:thioredoxin domain-containing protein [Sphingomonas rhizophila]QNN64262.1 thioredoxin domain-containing protein [Sphingomonas rhizophila]